MNYANDIVCQLLEYIDQNLNSQISINKIALTFAYDKYYLMKLFKKELGISIICYINQLRIYHALIDIQNTDWSLTRIALKNGFNSVEYFSEAFHQIMGIAPREFKFYYINHYLKSSKKIDSLLKNWSNVNYFFESISQYKKNRKPIESPVRKLSIF